MSLIPKYTVLPEHDTKIGNVVKVIGYDPATDYSLVIVEIHDGNTMTTMSLEAYLINQWFERLFFTLLGVSGIIGVVLTIMRYLE